MKKALVFAMAMFAMTVFGADISGTWKGTTESGDRTLERTFIFHVDGKKLTGETSSEMMGKSVITDGVVEGDQLSFSITGNVQGNDITLHYKGSVHGDEMKLSSEVNGQAIEWKVKKAS